MTKHRVLNKQKLKFEIWRELNEGKWQFGFSVQGTGCGFVGYGDSANEAMTEAISWFGESLKLDTEEDEKP